VAGLVQSRQSDFAAGMFQSVAAHLIPPQGFYMATNAMLDDDGSVYQRGGDRYLTNADAGSALRFCWNGVLPVGERTLIGGPDGLYAVVGETPVKIAATAINEPVRATVVAGVLYIDGGIMWAGAQGPVSYTAGSVTVTEGSPVVAGVDTQWLANVAPGALFTVGGGHPYVVKSVDSATTLTLAAPYAEVTAAGVAYALRATLEAGAANTPPASAIYDGIFDRLLAADGDRLRFSHARNQDTFIAETWLFDDDDNHQLPGQILGMAALRDSEIVFTTAGVHVVRGLQFDMLDPTGTNFQQRVEPVDRDLILWGRAGIAQWQNLLVAPCADEIYLVGDVQAPTPVARSIRDRYQRHVHAGFKPGLATVYRNHYFLPILTEDNRAVDMLVCRLDRVIATPIGDCRPWSRWSGHAADVGALCSRVGGLEHPRDPELMAAGLTDPRLLGLRQCFAPNQAPAVDADNSDFHWMLESRDFATGDENLNHVRRLRIRYELESISPYLYGTLTEEDGTYSELAQKWAGQTYADMAGDKSRPAPSILAYVSIGPPEDEIVATWNDSRWNEFLWSESECGQFELLAGAAPPDCGRDPHTWHFAKRARFIRTRLVCNTRAQNLRLRMLEWSIRQSAKAT